MLFFSPPFLSCLVFNFDFSNLLSRLRNLSFFFFFFFIVCIICFQEIGICVMLLRFLEDEQVMTAQAAIDWFKVPKIDRKRKKEGKKRTRVCRKKKEKENTIPKRTARCTLVHSIDYCERMFL